MKKLLIKTMGAVCMLTGIHAALACTDFKLGAADGTTLVARSMEFGLDLKSNLRSSNRGRDFKEVAPNGKPAMAWKAKYGYVFLDGLNVDATVDGMNEVGLSFECLYLPEETQYQTVPAGQEAHGLSYMRLGDWVLSNFKTIDEVKAALNQIYVFGQTLPGLGEVIFPVHFSIYDASGKGIVVEFVGGKMNVYDNTVGVLTNSPTYDWQVTNLRNYVNLTPWTPAPITIDNVVYSATGQGSGMKGIPGDTSPPSRFVKMSVFKAAVTQPANAAGALNIAQHMINNVDIPAGVVRAKVKDSVAIETTQWVVFKDLSNKVFYYRTYGDTTLHSVALSQVDFTENAKRLKMPIVDNQFILDVSRLFVKSVG